MNNVAREYEFKSTERTYRKLADMAGEKILAVEHLELIANFSFIPKTQQIITQKLSKYNIDPHKFSVSFDSCTFEFYPKTLKVFVYIYEFHYSFEFTKPQWLGQPRSKNTEMVLLGKTPD